MKNNFLAFCRCFRTLFKLYVSGNFPLKSPNFDVCPPQAPISGRFGDNLPQHKNRKIRGQSPHPKIEKFGDKAPTPIKFELGALIGIRVCEWGPLQKEDPCLPKSQKLLQLYYRKTVPQTSFSKNFVNFLKNCSLNMQIKSMF